MADKSDGQLSFDLNAPILASSEPRETSNEDVVSLHAHRERRDEAERARYFSEIIKLADHLRRSV